MTFIAQDLVTGQYITWDKDAIKLVPSKSKAKKFKDVGHWMGFRDGQLRKYCKENNLDIDRFKIVRRSEAGIAYALPDPLFWEWGLEETEWYGLKVNSQQGNAEGEDMDKEKNTVNMPVSVEAATETVKSLLDGVAHMDGLVNILSELPKFAGAASALADNIQTAMDFCKNEIKRADAESMDLAHKIEFSVLNVVGGYRMYKEFHECRLRRRKAKDALDLLLLISASGILEGIRDFTSNYGTYMSKLENRTYSPRIRDDLFQDKKAKKEEEEKEKEESEEKKEESE